MLREMALGWCAEGMRPPPEVEVKPLLGLALLTAHAVDARQVLALQQSCFEAGLDLLPLAAGAGWTAKAAEVAGRERILTLQARLRALAGQAQVTLMMDWEAAAPQGQTGRDWLRARSARAEAQTLAEGWLQAVGRGLDLPASPVERRDHAALIHLLAPRTALPDAAAVAALGRALPIDGARLTLVGPWPPHAFAGQA